MNHFLWPRQTSRQADRHTDRHRQTNGDKTTFVSSFALGSISIIIFTIHSLLTFCTRCTVPNELLHYADPISHTRDGGKRNLVTHTVGDVSDVKIINHPTKCLRIQKKVKLQLKRKTIKHGLHRSILSESVLRAWHNRRVWELDFDTKKKFSHCGWPMPDSSAFLSLSWNKRAIIHQQQFKKKQKKNKNKKVKRWNTFHNALLLSDCEQTNNCVTVN